MSLPLATKGTLHGGTASATKGVIHLVGLVEWVGKVLPQFITRRVSVGKIVRRLSVGKIVRREDA